MRHFIWVFIVCNNTCLPGSIKLKSLMPTTTFPNNNNKQNIYNNCGSVGRLFDLGSNGCWFEPHRRRSHCIVSLSKTFYPLLSRDWFNTGRPIPNMTDQLLTGTERIEPNKKATGQQIKQYCYSGHIVQRIHVFVCQNYYIKTFCCLQMAVYSVL